MAETMSTMKALIERLEEAIARHADCDEVCCFGSKTQPDGSCSGECEDVERYALPDLLAFVKRNTCECGHEAAEHAVSYWQDCWASVTEEERCGCRDYRPLAEKEQR